MPNISVADLGSNKTMPGRHWNMLVETTPNGPTKARRTQRGGLKSQVTYGDGPIRATFTFAGVNVTVSNGDVYYNGTVAGQIPTAGPVRWAISDTECVLVAGGLAWYVTPTAVTQIDDPDLPQVRDVLFITGRFIYVHASTDDQFSWSDIEDAQSIDGLAFASAESSPDPLLGGLIVADNIFFLKGESVEWWYPNDDPDAPFLRSRGRRYDKGGASLPSLVLVDNTAFWVANDRIIYRAGAVPQRISDQDMEARLQDMTEDQFSSIFSYRVIYSGHTLYVVTLPGVGTWAFDVGMNTWIRWTTWMGQAFRPLCSNEEGRVLGDTLTGQLMVLDSDTCTDLGQPIERVVSAFAPLAGGVQRNFNVALHCSKGVGLLTGYGSQPTVEMRFSDHEGADWTVWMDAPLGVMGDRSKAAMAQWTGLGSFQAPGRLYEFRCTDPVFFSCYQMSYNSYRP